MRDTTNLILAKRLITISIDDSIRKAYQIMQERKIRHLPVIDKTAVIVGLLSDRDVHRAMLPKSGVAASAWEDSAIEFNPEHRVSDFMSWPARSIPKNTPVTTAARIMLDEKLSALILTDAEAKHPCGIVTTDDLLKLLIDFLTENEDDEEAPMLVDCLDFHRFHF